MQVTVRRRFICIVPVKEIDFMAKMKPIKTPLTKQ